MAKRSLTIVSWGGSRRAKPLRSAFVALVVTCSPVLADALKTTMGEMAKTTKAAKAALSSANSATFDTILKAYAEEAKAGRALFPGGGAKNQDLRARFSAFAATVESAQQIGTSPASFRAAFSSIVSECRSCHGVYK